ncbi:unnamed protein product [Ilex paraguariensis]|uniref:MI domain-containing protein n=1 Tax=Ilex paraguariensis TaxID=185542 RepID=A0ABC8TW67_9AQUA
MVRDVLDRRANNWVPRQEEVKAKTINEIHSEAEKNLGLRPGVTASIRNNCGIASGTQGNISPRGIPMNWPGSGGMMPGTRRMPGMPGIDNEYWEVPRSRSMPRGDGFNVQPAGRVQPLNIGKSPSLNPQVLPQGTGSISGRTGALLQSNTGAPPVHPPNFGLGMDPASQVLTPARPVPIASVPPVAGKPLAPVRLNSNELRRKTMSLLEEYFSVRILDEALLCVEELKSPDYYPELVKESHFTRIGEKSSLCRTSCKTFGGLVCQKGYYC